MLSWLMKRKLDAFEVEYNYDVSYMRDMLGASPRALMAFAGVRGLESFRRGVPLEVLFAVKLVGTMAEDCGPCSQLVLTMAEREGVSPRTLAAVVRGDLQAVPIEVRDGVRFARAVLARDPEADRLREAIVARHGFVGLISLGFALTSARIYPTLKYALGHGQRCNRLAVANEVLAPVSHPDAR